MSLTLGLEIAGAVVAALVVTGVVLRVRKLHRDEMRDLSRPVERRLMAPPPSPYAPSKGFRLLDREGAPLQRPPVERPRLDPTQHYVFSELSGANEEIGPAHLRHNDDWFLSRTSHRSALSTTLRALAVFVLVAVVGAVLATYYVDHRDGPAHHDTTTTTTSATTTTIPPLTATSASGDDATYTVPLARYHVTVIARRGGTLATFTMGPSSTLEWRGTVALGAQESLVMTGDSRLRLGSPANVNVVVAGHFVVFPTPLPPALLLVFRSSS